MEEKALQSAGLTLVESKIYLTLLDKGASTAGTIAKKTKVNRRTVYDSMERLIEKGLIGFITKNNKKYYIAVNPTRLLEIIEKKKDDVDEIMPALQSKFVSDSDMQEVLFFEGKQGLRYILEDQLKEGKDLYVIGGSIHARDILSSYIDRFTKMRKQKKIKLKIIFNKEIKAKKRTFESKALNVEYNSPAATNIYGNKVALLVWSEENPLVILIHNKEIANSYREHFKLLWKLAKK